jgi:hypothetical protein
MIRQSKGPKYRLPVKCSNDTAKVCNCRTKEQELSAVASSLMRQVIAELRGAEKDSAPGHLPKPISRWRDS